MYRIAMMVFRLFLKAPFYFFQIWRCGKKKGITLEEAYACVRKVTIAANRAGKVKIESFGLENIPKESGFIFYPNHQGLYDVLAFLESWAGAFSFVINKKARNFLFIKKVVDAHGDRML